MMLQTIILSLLASHFIVRSCVLSGKYKEQTRTLLVYQHWLGNAQSDLHATKTQYEKLLVQYTELKKNADLK